MNFDVTGRNGQELRDALGPIQDLHAAYVDAIKTGEGTAR
jgi:hypothetical protein